MAVQQFTYSHDPGSVPRDAVRFALGDTLKARPLLDDREIEYAIGLTPGNANLAAATCADHLQGRFAAEADTRVGDISKSFSQVAKQYAALSKRLRHEATKLAAPRAPALSISEKATADQQTDDVQPWFRMGMTDNPFAVQINDALNGLDNFRGFF